MKEELFDSFFTGGAEFWIGKVVAIDAQNKPHKDLVGVGDIRFVSSAHILTAIILKIKIVTQRWSCLV